MSFSQLLQIAKNGELTVAHIKAAARNRLIDRKHLADILRAAIATSPNVVNAVLQPGSYPVVHERLESIVVRKLRQELATGRENTKKKEITPVVSLISGVVSNDEIVEALNIPFQEDGEILWSNVRYVVMVIMRIRNEQRSMPLVWRLKNAMAKTTAPGFCRFVYRQFETGSSHKAIIFPAHRELQAS